MRTIYEANDGTQFSTAEECKRYESKNLILFDRKKFLCFDQELHPIEFCRGCNFMEIIEDSYFFICFTNEAVAAFQKKVDEADESNIFPHIRKDILYGWSVDGNDCWSDVWKVVEDLEMQASCLREALHNMEDEIKKAKQGK